MNERILIIEDDQQILKLLQRGLAYEGYTVDTATDGRMGLILARDHTPDLVILDWMLPGMDGLEVCHRLRTGGSIPILMLTAKDTVQDRIQGLDAGADDYMIKPFNLDELLARVRALLRRTQPERVPVLKVRRSDPGYRFPAGLAGQPSNLIDRQGIRTARAFPASSQAGADARSDL